MCTDDVIELTGYPHDFAQVTVYESNVVNITAVLEVVQSGFVVLETLFQQLLRYVLLRK